MTKKSPGKVCIRRDILRANNAMLARGDFGDYFEAYHAHTRRWDLPLDGLGAVMMHQALAGAALQLSFRVLEEQTAWTLNVHKPPLNLFVAGGGPSSGLVGRYFTEDVATIGESRLFVQRSHPQREATRSVLSVEGLDVFGMAEQYYRKSEQLPARLVELSSTEMAMVLALPGIDEDWLSGLDGAAIRDLAETSEESVEERTFQFHCGCDGQRMVNALVKMFGDAPEEIFEDEDGIETRCPRCGARWWIDRESFDRARIIGG